MEQPIRRRRRRKKTPNSKQLLIAGCVIGAVALIVAACVFLGFWLGGGDDPAQPPRGALKELTVQELVREQETMVVHTSYLDVAFPYAFSDLISVEAVNQETATALTFTVTINKETYKLYTLWFNGEAGQTVGSLDLEDGYEPVRVSVAFYDPAGGLQGDDRKTFSVTQETVNDVLNSMKEDGHFKAN